jgi:hypothetical protein
MISELKKHSKKNTKQRNEKKALTRQNKWIDLEELVNVANREYSEVIKLRELSGI